MATTRLVPLQTNMDSVVWYAVTSPLSDCLPSAAQSPVGLYSVDLKASQALACCTSQPKTDTSKHFHIFVGDLSPDAETSQLRDAFTPFGQISDCKIIRDPQTSKSKGYGFVSFFRKEDAENAIARMNGQRIGGRPIRTNWAVRKPATSIQKDAIAKPMSFEEVYCQTSPTNCTVYCGGILTGLTEEMLHQAFDSFGVIQEIRVFKDKGYAFIRFSSKQMAAQAIVSMNGGEINGHIIKCSWGKETSESPAPASSPTQPAFTFVPQSYGIWSHPQGYQQQIQQQQQQQQQQQAFIQPFFHQGYSYATYVIPPVANWSAAGAAATGSNQCFVQQQGLLGYPVQQV